MEIALILLVVVGAVLYLTKRFRRSLSGSCGCACADCPGSNKTSPCQSGVELAHLQKLHAENRQSENLQPAKTPHAGEGSMCAGLISTGQTTTNPTCADQTNADQTRNGS